MWFVTAAFAADPAPSPEEAAPAVTAPASSSAPRAEPDPLDAAELRELARKHTTRGAVEVGLGLGLAAGGVFVLSYQRGETGALSQEEPWLMDLRSVGGALLTIGGLTTLVVGGNDVSVGRRLRLQAASIRPALLDEGAGVVIGARF